VLSPNPEPCTLTLGRLNPKLEIWNPNPESPPESPSLLIPEPLTSKPHARQVAFYSAIIAAKAKIVERSETRIPKPETPNPKPETPN